jgi:Co/Zn/Cd efflux system component
MPSKSTDPVNAAFFGLALTAALTPKLLGSDLVIIETAGAFQHILNDLFAFIATAVAGLIILLTGWTRADAIADLIVAASDGESWLRTHQGVLADLPGSRSPVPLDQPHLQLRLTRLR